MDTILKEHLNNATVFQGTSKTIQNEILDSMLAVCRQEIEEQIKESDFLSIQCDETTDVSNQCDMVIIIRYFYNGQLYERFWTFLRVADKSADGLTHCIENELNKLIPNSHTKLIAQTYDGANMSGATGGVQTKIKNKYNFAHFVHCYAHQLNLVMQKATSQNPRVKIFFSNLSSIPSFFSSSTHRCEVFDEIVNRMLPRVIAAAHWTYNIRTVNVVHENRERLIECFEELGEKCNKTITCKEADTLRITLEDPDFVFWLELFYKIFPVVENTYDQFQSRNKHSDVLREYLEIFERNIMSIRNSLDELGQEMPSNENKRRKISPEYNNSVIAKEVCDTIIFQLKERLSCRGHLEAASLVNESNFLQYCRQYPTPTLSSVIRHYPMLQQDKLKAELEVIYSRRDFNNIEGCLNIMSWINVNGLNETFSETVKLLKIIVTTPMYTTESERCFSTLKEINTFLRNTMNEERLNALAMMSVNKNLIHNISNFDEKVMEHFISQQGGRSDFVFKQ